MTYNFNVSGADRKNLVKAISEHLGIKAKYLGVPSCAYQIGTYTVSKDGALSWNDLDDADPAHLEKSCSLVQALEAAGFHSDEATFFADQQEAIELSESKNSKQELPGCCIQIPASVLSDSELELLRQLIDGKGSLIKKAINADCLDIIKNEEVLCFPWYEEIPDAEMISAVSVLITKLIEAAKKAKRVNITDHSVENEKYAFRCFLLRLGFIGDEYKNERRTLTKNLLGVSAFRNPKIKEEA